MSVMCYPQVVERILFVHAKCNKGIGYVQVGMATM